MRRLLGIGTFLGAFALGGCGGDDDADRARVDRAESEVQAAIDGVLHDAAEQAGMDFEAGNRFFVICGESYAPGGVHIRNLLRFGAPRELPTEAAIEAVAGVLDDAGWSIERPPNPKILEAAKGVVVLKLDFRLGVTVDVGTECIETSDDVARETSERRNADLEWK